MGALVVICVAFLAGSFPTGIVLGRLATGRDIRTVGSGNFGAANVARAAGLKVGVAVALLDVLKGLLPVLLGARLGLGHSALALTALAAVLGHDFSIFVGFRGGKGVATSFGVALMLAPPASLVAGAAWLAVLGVWGYTSLASLLALALLPLLMGVTGQPPAYVVLASILFVLGWGKHWENIIRLAYGRESGFKSRRAANGR
ncbi:MAG: glycerol-3-phosphate 1-O-acyltransferase PlsY [Chloroflexi bacterium]|nr:glycerol-3-phosphate 1-O-acyltransferase PlsY [Chloroflexota bacterium]